MKKKIKITIGEINASTYLQLNFIFTPFSFINNSWPSFLYIYRIRYITTYKIKNTNALVSNEICIFNIRLCSHKNIFYLYLIFTNFLLKLFCLNKKKKTKPFRSLYYFKEINTLHNKFTIIKSLLSFIIQQSTYFKYAYKNNVYSFSLYILFLSQPLT